MKETNKKRAAITVYVSIELSETLTKKYASAVLHGYNGTKQAFLNDLLNFALKEFNKDLNVLEGFKNA